MKIFSDIPLVSIPKKAPHVYAQTLGKFACQIKYYSLSNNPNGKYYWELFMLHRGTSCKGVSESLSLATTALNDALENHTKKITEELYSKCQEGIPYK
jgi:hypothetical protein